MRAIDDYTPQELEMLWLKNMLPQRGHWDEAQEHDRDLEHESRQDYASWETDNEGEVEQ